VLFTDIADTAGRRPLNLVYPPAIVTDFHVRHTAKGMDAAMLRASMHGYDLLRGAAHRAAIGGAITFVAGTDASLVTGQAIAVDGGAAATGAGQ
jgi:NAD(P)-dependent dehydrogenase (short-subunit alcohol dehydrogenase family)